MKIEQNSKCFYWITSISIVVMLLLQITWLYNTYILIQTGIREKISEIIESSLKKEVNVIALNLPEGVEIIGGPEGEAISQCTYLYDGLLKLGIEFSSDRIDSIASLLLREENLNCEFTIRYLDTKRDNVNNEDDIFVIKSDIIPLKLDLSKGVQLVLRNPYMVILQRMVLLIVATLMMASFIVFCIIYQLSIISHMNKIFKIREDFSYALIHDMKNPLSTIFTTLNFLHTGRLDDKPEKREKYFRIAEGEVDHLLTLTNKVLTVSKLEQHKLDMQKEKIELLPMIDKLVDKFTAKADKPICFIKDLQATEVYADAEYLEEVLDNLIDNAVKYSKENVEITLSSSCNGRHTFLRGHDNGIGISDKDQKVIFNKYERGAAGRRKRKQGASGFGLGLNFVQQVVEAHGGNIFVNSIEGEFTEFVISLPLQDLN